MLPCRLIKLGFYLLYHQLAFTYELVAWLVSFGQWAAWRRLALLIMQPGPTLELAYGTGVFFLDMLAAGHRPVGLDISPYMAQQAGQRLRRQNYALPLCQAQAQAIPFPSGHFVNVIATFPTDYMLQPDTLVEIKRVLRNTASTPDGHTPRAEPLGLSLGTKPRDEAAGRLIIVAEGQLRGPWPLRPLINWLYKITNQRTIPPEQPLKLLAAHDFDARWELVEHKGAQARLLIAGKHR